MVVRLKMSRTPGGRARRAEAGLPVTATRGAGWTPPTVGVITAAGASVIGIHRTPRLAHFSY